MGGLGWAKRQTEQLTSWSKRGEARECVRFTHPQLNPNPPTTTKKSESLLPSSFSSSSSSLCLP